MILTSFLISTGKLKLFLKTEYTKEYRFLTNCSQRFSYFVCCHRNGSYQTQLFTMYSVDIIGADTISEYQTDLSIERKSSSSSGASQCSSLRYVLTLMIPLGRIIGDSCAYLLVCIFKMDVVDYIYERALMDCLILCPPCTPFELHL